MEQCTLAILCNNWSLFLMFVDTKLRHKDGCIQTVVHIVSKDLTRYDRDRLETTYRLNKSYDIVSEFGGLSHSLNPTVMLVIK